MKNPRRSPASVIYTGLILLAISLGGCDSRILEPPGQGGSNHPSPFFPEFITPADSYFETSIAGAQQIDGESYRLKITGAVDNPVELSLHDLLELEMVERPLTIECIGNPAGGSLVGTARWKGFRVYDLLESLGIREGATAVKYTSADGYFTYNSLEQLRDQEVIGALYMNGESIPEQHGYPLRIIFPGYYGVRQPGWITEIEVMDEYTGDFWSQFAWETDSAMVIDSRIFFPKNRDIVFTGDSVTVGGAAYGAMRIRSVEISPDGGQSWIPADIVQQADEDFVWVFWEASFIPDRAGNYTIRSRATGTDGSIQPEKDEDTLDGNNAQPSVTITVIAQK
jgi:hypothetical protein